MNAVEERVRRDVLQTTRNGDGHADVEAVEGMEGLRERTAPIGRENPRIRRSHFLEPSAPPARRHLGNGGSRRQ